MEEIVGVAMAEAMARLTAAAEKLEMAAEVLAERQVSMIAAAEENVGRIVATVETERERELEARLEQAEAKIAELTASAAGHAVEARPTREGRKTLSVGTTSMLAKHGVTVEAMDAGAIDGALSSLSIEQRIAVKAELLRAGVLA